MEPRVKRTQRAYTMDFTRAVVEQVEQEKLTCPRAQATYGIRGRSTELSRLRRYGRLGWRAAASTATMPIDKQPWPLTPEQQIKTLQLQLGEANERRRPFGAALDMLKRNHGAAS